MQPAVETFNVAILPRAVGPDVQRLDADLVQPAADLGGNELRPVVTADVPGQATPGEQVGQRVDHVLAGDAAIRPSMPGTPAPCTPFARRL